MAEGVGQAIVLALCALIPAGFGAYLIRWGLQNKADGDAFLADATETVAEVIETSQSQTRDRDGDRRTRYSAKVAFAPEGHEPVTAWISGVAREGDRIRICYRRSDPTQVRRADAVYEASGLLYVIGAGCLLIALQFLGGSVSKLYMASKKGTWRDEDRLLHLSSRRPSLTSLDEAVRDGAPELPASGSARWSGCGPTATPSPSCRAGWPTSTACGG